MADGDLPVLLPDRTLTLSGETVTVRELRFAESLRLAPEIRPIVESLAAFPALDNDADEDALFEDLLAEHWERIVRLMSITCGCERAWIENLPEQEGQQLAMTWWAVNAGFFMRRLVAKRMTAARKASRCATGTSSSS